MKLDKEAPYYYQKKGIIYFLFLIVVNFLCFKFVFRFDSLYVGFYVDFLVFLISGPVAIMFVGGKDLLGALLYMLVPLFFLLLIKTENSFRIFIASFLAYWIVFGGLLFIGYTHS